MDSPNIKFHKLLKLLDVASPVLRTQNGRRQLMKLLSSAAGGAGVGFGASELTEKTSNMDKAERVFEKLSQEKKKTLTKDDLIKKEL